MRPLSKLTIAGIAAVIICPLVGLSGTVWNIYGSFDSIKTNEGLDAARTVRTQAGTVEAYDELIVAIGSRPILIPVPGHDLPGGVIQER